MSQHSTKLLQLKVWYCCRKEHTDQWNRTQNRHVTTWDIEPPKNTHHAQPGPGWMWRPVRDCWGNVAFLMQTQSLTFLIFLLRSWKWCNHLASWGPKTRSEGWKMETRGVWKIDDTESQPLQPPCGTWDYLQVYDGPAYRATFYFAVLLLNM